MLMETYRQCLLSARQARLDGDNYTAAWWLAEAMASRIEYIHGPAPIGLEAFKAYAKGVNHAAL